MRAPLSLLVFGLAAMLGPLVGASMPWAPTVHAWLLGDWPGGAVAQAPHMLFALMGVMGGVVVAWVGVVWLCGLALRRGASREWGRR